MALTNWHHDVRIDTMSVNGIPDEYVIGVWADNKFVKIIKDTEGVSHLLSAQGNFFLVQIDRRYDPSWVTEEIIANIKIDRNEIK